MAPRKPLLQHLSSENNEAWMGLIDGVYAVAMTMIAIELPGLVLSLIQVPNEARELAPLTAIITYEFITYIATFLILYELWSFHKSILLLARLSRRNQNLINGFILAVTCLGAGNTIVILKAKTEAVSEALSQGATHSQLMQDWLGSTEQFGLITFLIVAGSYGLLAALARQSKTTKSASDLLSLERSSWRRGVLFLALITLWSPLLMGSQQPLLPPAPVVVGYLIATHIRSGNFQPPTNH